MSYVILSIIGYVLYSISIYTPSPTLPTHLLSIWFYLRLYNISSQA